MVKNANSPINNSEIDPELERLKEKSAKGAINIFEDLLNDPVIQQSIKKTLMRKFLIPIIAVTCLFIGILGLFDVAKQLLGLGWQMEITISLVLLTIGLSYLIKSVFTGKKHAD